MSGDSPLVNICETCYGGPQLFLSLGVGLPPDSDGRPIVRKILCRDLCKYQPIVEVANSRGSQLFSGYEGTIPEYILPLEGDPVKIIRRYLQESSR